MSEKIEFANRSYELNEICRPGAAPLTVIDAPAGFGKSRLLEAIRKKHQDGITSIARGKASQIIRWKCALIDLKVYHGGNSIVEIRKEVVRQVDGNVPSLYDSVDSDAADLALRVLLIKCSPALLMFDSVERSDNDALRWLHKKLLPQLVDAFENAQANLKIIVAGRYVEARTGDKSPQLAQYRPSWVKSGYNLLRLSQFTEETVEDILINKRPDLKKDVARRKRFSSYIMSLSGGHPKTIVEIISYLENMHWAINFNDSVQQNDIYENCIKPAITEVLSIIVDDSLQKGLEILSVFRIFNLNTIDYLINHKRENGDSFLTQTEPLALFTELRRITLIDRKDFGYSDSLVRSLILTRMRADSPHLYEEINRTALAMYDRWISETIASPPRRGTDHSTSVADYIREALYHLSQLPDINEVQFTRDLKKYADNLERVGFIDPVYQREVIEDMLQDQEIERVFKQQNIKIDRLLGSVFSPTELTADGPEAPKNVRALRVFLSYASEDKSKALEIYSLLQKDGYEPWLDKKDLVAGEDWNAAIRQAVKTSDATLVCLSPASVFKSGYFQKEIKLILDVADEKPPETIFIIPVKLEECEIPERFCHLHTVNYFEEEGYREILRALQKRARDRGIADAIKK